jgi:hypothetical protein
MGHMPLLLINIWKILENRRLIDGKDRSCRVSARGLLIPRLAPPYAQLLPLLCYFLCHTHARVLLGRCLHTAPLHVLLHKLFTYSLRDSVEYFSFEVTSCIFYTTGWEYKIAD